MRVTLYRIPDSPFWWCNFTVDGRRVRRSTGIENSGARKAEARERAGRLLAQALTAAARPGAPVTIEVAAERYYQEVIRHHRNADDEETALARIVERLGPQRPLHEISDGDIAELVARRRGDRRRGNGWGKGRHNKDKDYGRVGNRTVNADTKLLRALINRVELWGQLTGPKRQWARHLLPEADERDGEIGLEAEERLWAAIAADRPDMLPMLTFALLSGLRRANVIGLRWPQVDEAAGVITYQAKSRRPGGVARRLPLTPELLAILQGERGNHPVQVFTFVAARTAGPKSQRKVKGERYPFTETGWRRTWRRAVAAAGLTDVHVHDLRHTIASRVLRNSGNLRAVQKMLGHARIETTLRYAHVLDDDVRQAMLAGGRRPLRVVKKQGEG